MAAKRKLKEAEDLKDQQANILLQRKAGKDQAEALEKMKQKEAAKLAQEMKQAKEDDAKQRRQILEQIKRDKEERAAKAAREKALREGKVEIGTPLPLFFSSFAPPLGSHFIFSISNTGRGSKACRGDRRSWAFRRIQRCSVAHSSFWEGIRHHVAR